MVYLFFCVKGSYLEGGGQILRISTALSVLLNKPIQVTRIRANRKGAGLKAQHLTGIQLLAEISQAKLTNAHLKSTEITFAPIQLKSGDFVADIGTAGSISLLMQNSIPCIIFGPESTRIFLRGGTNVAFSPPIDYFELIFQPMSQKLGNYQVEYSFKLDDRILNSFLTSRNGYKDRNESPGV